jgi:hypothetical protein
VSVPGLDHLLTIRDVEKKKGYFAVQQPAFQDALHAGLRTPMVTLLCGLPFEFFNSPAFDALGFVVGCGFFL